MFLKVLLRGILPCHVCCWKYVLAKWAAAAAVASVAYRARVMYNNCSFQLRTCRFSWSKVSLSAYNNNKCSRIRQKMVAFFSAALHMLSWWCTSWTGNRTYQCNGANRTVSTSDVSGSEKDVKTRKQTRWYDSCWWCEYDAFGTAWARCTSCQQPTAHLREPWYWATACGMCVTDVWLWLQWWRSLVVSTETWCLRSSSLFRTTTVLSTSVHSNWPTVTRRWDGLTTTHSSIQTTLEDQLLMVEVMVRTLMMLMVLTVAWRC